MKHLNCSVIFNKQKDQALFCKRTKEPYKGLYNFVGGKVESGETALGAAYRELLEETGIAKDDIRLFRLMDFTYYEQEYVLEIYVGQLQKDVQLREEVNPLEWLPLTENFADSDRFAGEQNIAHIIKVALKFPLEEKTEDFMRNQYIDILEKQLAIDYDCTIEEVKGSDNVYRVLKTNPKARPVGNADTYLKIIVYKEKLMVMAHPELLGWCEQLFGNEDGIWLSEPENLVKINSKLMEYGQRLADTHHYYIPAQMNIPFERRFEMKWYERNEIEIFRGDNRFWEALLFDENTPDMLAVCAVEDDVILGMASATRDCERLWQIGVNVTQEGRGKGVGSYVTTLLKDELLHRGIVPTYATVESHIKSQKVAFQSGFMPIFYEIFSDCV